jgi:formylglycine-generating enzyme required for sulfatase activity
VIDVNHDQAVGYLNWLAKKTGKKYRLLSEAEWEYVARAGSNEAYYWGNAPDLACQFANVANARTKAKYNNQFHGLYDKYPPFDCEDGYTETAPKGSFEPNAFGLYDMLGNVWEWVEDCYNQTYDGAPADGSAWATGDCSRRVARGGGWGSRPPMVRSAYRLRYEPSDRFNFLGLRVARTLP